MQNEEKFHGLDGEDSVVRTDGAHHSPPAATREENPKLRARITGWNQKGKLRYRRSQSQACAGKAKSVFADVIETDFARLVEFLNIDDNALELMTKLAIQVQYPDDVEEDKLEERKRIEITRIQRAMKNVRDLGRAGYMDADEVIRDLRNLDGELEVWHTMTNDHQQVRTNLMTCMEIVRRLKVFWADAEGEDKRILAHSLFEEIVYHMDGRQIVDFTVKAWAEPFLIYRADLLEDDGAVESKNRLVGGFSTDVLSRDPNGRRGSRQYMKDLWMPSGKFSLQYNGISQLSRIATLRATQF